MKRKNFLLSILILVGLAGYGQTDQSWFSQGWSVNLNAGPNLFYGDIEVYNFYPVMNNNSEWRIAYGAMVQKQLGAFFAARGQFLHGQLSGTKRKYNRWFEANVIETSAGLTFNVSSFIWGIKDRKLSVYAMAGIGLTQWRTELKDLKTNELIRANGFTGGRGLGGRTLVGVLPFGMGLDYKVTDNWRLNLEMTLRPVNSDLLDANEGAFPYDFYSYNFVGISYVFAKKKTMPPVEYPVDDRLITEETLVEPHEATEIALEDKPDVERDDILDKELRDIESKILEDEGRTGLYEPTYPGIVFRVQVLASREELKTNTVAGELKLNEEVFRNEGDGWYRYSVGSFGKYWKAKEYRNILVTRYNIYDAFVVAYSDEERMPLTGVVSREVLDAAEDSKTATSPYTFRVQILAARNDDIDVSVLSNTYGISEEIRSEKSGNWFRYSAGSFTEFQEAVKYRDKMVRNGIRDAFVVAYRNGIRVPLSEAIR